MRDFFFRFFCALVFFWLPLQAANKNCFLVSEKGHVLYQEGSCDQRYSPCCTFKIPIALMGYNEDILKNEVTPEWSFKKEYVGWREAWNAPHNSLKWMKNSCLWYSQQVTIRLGWQKFKKYLKKFSYGNQDGSGDKRKNNGLMGSWLSSSLRISPREQLAFLDKLTAHQLPVSERAHQNAERILRLESLPHGWELYGRTGGGYAVNKKGLRTQGSIHWFVGWVQKGDRKVAFVYFRESPHSPFFKDGRDKKETVLKKLQEIIL